MVQEQIVDPGGAGKGVGKCNREGRQIITDASNASCLWGEELNPTGIPRELVGKTRDRVSPPEG